MLVLAAGAVAVRRARAGELARWEGQYADTTQPDTMIAESSARWKRLWNRMNKTAPPFDEQRQTGIGIFLGRRNTGGYGVTVVAMGPRAGRFFIEIAERRPAEGAYVTQALTSPWLILLIERPGLPIVIEPPPR